MAYGNERGDDPMPTPQQLVEHETKAAAAIKVACRQCGAKPHEPCINRLTGHPLRKIVTHSIRLTDAETITPFPSPITDEDAEELF